MRRAGARRNTDLSWIEAAQLCAFLFALFAAPPAVAQTDDGQVQPFGPILAPAQNLTPSPPTPEPAPLPGILVLNQERLLSQAAMGRRIQREVEAASRALAAENRAIEARLTEEELELTDLRPTLPAGEFAELADDFDARVEGIRRAQEAKARALQAQADAAQARFFELAFPVLLELVQDRGAQVLMDNRAVLLASEGVDITDAAIARVDAALGEGGTAPLIDLDGTGARARPDAAEGGAAPEAPSEEGAADPSPVP
jgi:Skp family chaperone for outer membrane proteins